jgi:hypothetical protein
MNHPGPVTRHHLGPVRALGSLLHVDTYPETCQRQRGRSQLLVVAGALACYEVAHLLSGSQRGVAIQHARAVLRFEHLLYIDWEQSAQSFSLHNDVLRSVANGVYTWMYWPVIVGALFLTWYLDRRHYVLLRDGMLLSGAVGLAVFIFYPVAPPRMLSQFTDTISPGSVEHTVVHGSIADSYAALPSFHVGWVALATLILARSASRSLANPVRALPLLIAAVATAAMAAATVVTANHFVLDALTGIGLCLAGGALAAHLHGGLISVRDGSRGPVRGSARPSAPSAAGRSSPSSWPASG